MYSMANLTLICLALITLIKCCRTENVPVIIWTNIRNPNCVPNTLKYPGEHSLHFLQGHFMSCLLQSQPDEIKILITNTLTQKLFATHEKEFSNLMNTLNSVVYEANPAVDATNIAEDIETYLQENKRDANLSVPYLPNIEYNNEEAMKRTIQELDERINEILQSVNRKYIAILTAEGTSSELQQSDNKATGRQLLQAPATSNDNSNFIVSDCLYLNFSSVNVTIGTEQSDLTLKNNSVDCKYPDAKANLVFSSTSTKLGDVTIQMNFKSVYFNVSGREWWYMETSSVQSSLGVTPLDPNTFKNIWSAPGNWSWACYTPDVLKSSPTDKTNPATKLQFNIIEIEVFNVTGNTFTSKRVDCSGLLTAGIWMGILVSLILVAIFAFGMAFIANVSTMDKFDDPKGKALITSLKD